MAEVDVPLVGRVGRVGRVGPRPCDVCVTAVIFGLGVWDLTLGIINFVDPAGPYGTLRGSIPVCPDGDAETDKRIMNMVKLSSVGAMEGGAAVTILSAYRVYRYYKSRPFSPVSVLVALALDVAGTFFKFSILWVVDPPDALWWILGRGVLCAVTWLLATYAYWEQLVEIFSDDGGA